MVDAVGDFVSLIVEFIVWPFSDLLPVWQLVAVSALFGFLIVLVYGRVSFQERLKRTKRRIAALILESVLFRHDLRITLSAQAKLLWQGVVYLGLAIPPLVILSIPCILFLAQLNLRYGLRPLVTGEPAILEATIAGGMPFEAISLAAPSEVSITPPLRDSKNRTISWRVSSATAGMYQLVMKFGERGTFSQPLAVGKDGPVIPVTSKSTWEKLMFPSSVVINEQLPLSRIELSYPDRTLSLFGRSLNWIVLFFVVSLVSGLVGSRVFGIEV